MTAATTTATTETAYDVYVYRLHKWRRKISKTDSLKYEKRDALEVAIGLGYTDQTLSRIILASSAIQISRALTNARQTA